MKHIKSFSQSINEANSESPAELKKHKNRILDLLKKEDRDEISKFTKVMAAKITNKEKASARGNVARELARSGKYDSKILNMIARIFLKRADEL
jgi:preprotein translocase subunit Sss1